MKTIIADDSRIMRKVLVRICREVGNDPIAEATNGPDAVELCRQHKPDLVILDNTMTGGNGEQAASKILDEKLAPLVAMISLDSRGDSFKHLADRGVRLLAKPCDDSQIRAFLEKIRLEYAVDA